MLKQLMLHRRQTDKHNQQKVSILRRKLAIRSCGFDFERENRNFWERNPNRNPPSIHTNSKLCNETLVDVAAEAII